MTAFAGIFFDLGGTLFSYRNVARTNIPILIEAAARLGAEPDPQAIKRAYESASYEVTHRYADKPFYLHRDLFRDMFARYCELLDLQDDPDVQQWYLEAHRQAIIDCLEIKADCIRTLEFLRTRGLYLSIVSNIDNDMLDPLIEREGLHRYFDHWTSSESAQSCKPDGGFFEFVLGRSGLAPERVLFVGDSPEHDIAGANTAGMKTALIVEEGIEPPLQSGRAVIGSDYTIHALDELKAIV